MKKLFSTTLICCFINFAFAQTAFVASAKKSAMSYATDATLVTSPDGTVSTAPDATVTYSKELSQATQIKNRLYDKTLIWFYKSFFHSYDKIISSNKESGIIVGRTFFYSSYNVPKKADSVKASDYTNYNFEWTAKIENGKVNFSIDNIYINMNVYVTNDINQKMAVTKATKIPFSVLSKSDKKMEIEWNLSKAYLVNNLNALTVSLNKELETDDDLNWIF